MTGLTGAVYREESEARAAQHSSWWLELARWSLRQRGWGRRVELERVGGRGVDRHRGAWRSRGMGALASAGWAILPWRSLDGDGRGKLSSRWRLGGERVGGRGAILGLDGIDKWLFEVGRPRVGRFAAWVASSGLACRSAYGLPEPRADVHADLREPRADLRAAWRGRFCGPTPPPCPSDHSSREW